MARELGYTVGELLERITYEELVEWMLYYRIEPFGLTDSFIRNMSGKSGRKGSRGLSSPEQDSPRYVKSSGKMTVEEARANIGRKLAAFTEFAKRKAAQQRAMGIEENG